MMFVEYPWHQRTPMDIHQGILWQARLRDRQRCGDLQQGAGDGSRAGLGVTMDQDVPSGKLT